MEGVGSVTVVTTSNPLDMDLAGVVTVTVLLLDMR